MTTTELLATVRRVEVRTNRLVNDTMVGVYLGQHREHSNVRLLARHLIVPKGQNTNSRGREPMGSRQITFDPAGVAPVGVSQPWVCTHGYSCLTALRSWKQGRGKLHQSKHTGFSSPEFEGIRNRLNGHHG